MAHPHSPRHLFLTRRNGGEVQQLGSDAEICGDRFSNACGGCFDAYSRDT